MTDSLTASTTKHGPKKSSRRIGWSTGSGESYKSTNKLTCSTPNRAYGRLLMG